jgi:hypothetical protein
MSASNISPKRQIRVHYLHGLESGTTGRKVQLLRAAGYKVTAPAMLCAPNSILYHDPIIFYPLLLISASVLIITVFFGWYKGVALMMVLSIVLLNYSRVISTKLAERSFQRCVQQQLDVINADATNHTPADIYVASSFGGAVLLELVNRRCWGDARPPLLFLASAHKRTSESMGLVNSPVFPSPLGHPCTIVHGSQDTVVPLEDSYVCFTSVIFSDEFCLSVRFLSPAKHLHIRAAMIFRW